jgi:hypothetical protein|eukprot:COSAG01_NODE_10909_length_2053_cov_51.801433_1_plen_60_part_00
MRTFRTDAFTPKSWPQEIPAVYSNGAYHHLVTYNGSAPYTVHAGTYIRIQQPGRSERAR